VTTSSRLSRFVVGALLFSADVSLAKKPDPPSAYANSKTLTASCDAVWSAVPAMLANRGFMPESSDRAGGFMRLRYTRGDSGFGFAGKDVKGLALERGGGLTTYRRFASRVGR